MEENTEKYIDKIVNILAGDTSIVYFIKCNEYIKIGVSCDNFMNRIGSLQVGNPYKLSLDWFILGGYEKESKLHKYFKEFKVDGHGEWFKINREQYLKAIKELF